VTTNDDTDNNSSNRKILYSRYGRYVSYIDEYEISPIEIYLFRQHHVGNVEFSSLKNEDIINVKICGSKWGYKDTQINSIAQYVNLV
jgi:hypothetical protein